MRPAIAFTFVAIAVGVTSSALAQDRELDRAEESGRFGRTYETGNLRRPGARDPFDHTASFDIGVYRHRDSTALGSSTVALLPMRLGIETLVGDHWQIRGRFGIAGAVQDTEVTGVGGSRERTFRPGNTALGSYYTMGGDEKVMWTIGAGGQLSLPTAQPGDYSSGEALAYVGGLAVHGMEDAWLFLPKTFSIVPGAYARFATGPVFANARLDMSLNVPTDGRDSPGHLMQFRVEAGYRGSETIRLGLAYTNVLQFGGNVSGDRSQGALRVFLRADIKILTVGCELVMNLDDPLGFAFDDGGYWGVVSTVGLSL